MIKKIIFKLLLRWYIKYNREIHKMSLEDEFMAFTLNTYEDTIKLLKKTLTAQTVRYFEATSEEERMMTKGAANILKIILDGHERAMRIDKLNATLDRKVEYWARYKEIKRTD